MIRQRFLNTALYLLGRFLQLPLSELSHHRPGFSRAAFLFSWIWIALSIFYHQLHRGARDIDVNLLKGKQEKGPFYLLIHSTGHSPSSAAPSWVSPGNNPHKPLHSQYILAANFLHCTVPTKTTSKYWNNKQ